MKITLPKLITNTNNNYNSKPVYSNLAPLARDTVSFSSRAKFVSSDIADAPTLSSCIDVKENAKVAESILKSIFSRYINPLVDYNKTNNTQKYPVADSSTRIKTPRSILEKVVSKHSRLREKESIHFSKTIANAIYNKYPELNSDMSKQMLSAKVLGIVRDNNNWTSSKSPYEAANEHLSTIIPMLEKNNFFKNRALSESESQELKESISKSIHDNTPSVGTARIKPDCIYGIKHYANDIVGGRIILSEPNPKYVQNVIDQLYEAVKSNDIKVISIENHVPNPNMLPKGKNISDYEYATDSQLKKFANDCGCEYIRNLSVSGYCGIHINAEFPQITARNGFDNKYCGYKAEIQIIGKDVAELKDVEDLCYKLKDNKYSISKKYDKFKKYFLKYYNKSDDIKKAFDEYTYAAYLAQRSLPYNVNVTNKFPTIKELGFEGRVPKELDFNKLFRLKNQCDEEAEAE